MQTLIFDYHPDGPAVSPNGTDCRDALTAMCSNAKHRVPPTPPHAGTHAGTQARMHACTHTLTCTHANTHTHFHSSKRMQTYCGLLQLRCLPVMSLRRAALLRPLHTNTFLAVAPVATRQVGLPITVGVRCVLLQHKPPQIMDCIECVGAHQLEAHGAGKPTSRLLAHNTTTASA